MTGSGYLSSFNSLCISVLVKLELVYTHKIHYETVTFLATRTGHMSHLESSSRSLPRFAGKSSEYLAWRSAVRLAHVLTRKTDAIGAYDRWASTVGFSLTDDALNWFLEARVDDTLLASLVQNGDLEALLIETDKKFRSEDGVKQLLTDWFKWSVNLDKMSQRSTRSLWLCLRE